MSQLYAAQGRILTPEESLRRGIALQRACEVFGNDFHAGEWLFSRPPGHHWSPQDVAIDSPEGLQSVLAQLDEMAQTIKPQELPASIRAARSGRRLRRKKSDFR